MMKRLMSFLVAAMVLSLAMQGGVVRFAIPSDVHVTPGNANEGKLREAVAKMVCGEWKKCALPDRWDGRTAERIVQIITQ